MEERISNLRKMETGKWAGGRGWYGRHSSLEPGKGQSRGRI